MQIPEHKFIVERIAESGISKSHKAFQSFVLRKPAPVDRFGDPISDDDLFKITVWGKHTESLPPLKAGDCVSAALSITGKEDIDYRGKYSYQLQITARNIKKLDI